MSADALLPWCISEQDRMEEELMLTQLKCLNYCHGMGKVLILNALAQSRRRPKPQWAPSILSIT